VVDKKYKIYSKVQSAMHPHFEFGTRDLGIVGPAGVKRPPGRTPQALDLGGEADRLILSKYTPAGVVINGAMDILQFRGHTSPFLEPAQGEASLSLPKMVRQGLLMDLRAALHQAKSSHHAVRKENLRIHFNDRVCSVSLEVVPLRGDKTPDDY
jgi:two-component system CheB/CheR fusion protein